MLSRAAERVYWSGRYLERAEGMWNNALPVSHAMSVHDEVRCKTFTEIVVTEGGHPYVIGPDPLLGLF